MGVAVASLGWVFGSALVVLPSACRPSVQAEGPGTGPSAEGGAIGLPRADHPLGAGRHVVLGEVCVSGAAGGPVLAPLFMRGISWTAEPAELSSWVERGTGARFEVFGVDGKRAGYFDTLAALDGGDLPQDLASGGYTGSPPCTRELARGDRQEEPRCTVATGGCGLAVADLEVSANLDSHTITPDLVGGACASASAIVVDIDGDGVFETFSTPALLDPVRAPAEDWVADGRAPIACTPQFATYGIALDTADPSKPVDLRSVVGVDLLAVADLDGDGRRELVLALHYPDRRSIVVYTATESATRLQLAGEATTWMR